jgi:hypothetical protein
MSLPVRRGRLHHGFSPVVPWESKVDALARPVASLPRGLQKVWV